MLYFAGEELRAIKCWSHLYRKLDGKHYTSICNKDKRKGKNTSSSVLCTEVSKALVYPVAIVIVNCIKCRALLDISSSSVYVSLALINQIKIALKRMKQKSIEMLIGIMFEMLYLIAQMEIRNLFMRSLKNSVIQCYSCG